MVFRNYFIRPWDEKSKKILDQLTKDRVSYTSDKNLPRMFGLKYPDFFGTNNSFADIAFIDKRKETVFVLRPGSAIMPLKEKKKYRFYKFF